MIKSIFELIELILKTKWNHALIRYYNAKRYIKKRGWPVFLFVLRVLSDPHNIIWLEIGTIKFTISFGVWDGFLQGLLAYKKRSNYIADSRTSVFTKLIGIELEGSWIQHRLVFYIGPMRLGFNYIRVGVKSPLWFELKYTKEKMRGDFNQDLHGKQLGMDGEYGF